jgi:predicted PurR-regulated permease PerM
VFTVATVVYAAVWPVVFLLPKDGEGDPQGGLALVTLTSFVYVILLLLIGTPILADWLNERW